MAPPAACGAGRCGRGRGQARPTVYVAYPNLRKAGTITPISVATNTPGKPIHVRLGGYGNPSEIVVTP